MTTMHETDVFESSMQPIEAILETILIMESGMRESFLLFVYGPWADFFDNEDVFTEEEYPFVFECNTITDVAENKTLEAFERA